MFEKFDENQAMIRKQISAWLEEDIGTGDISSMSTISSVHQSQGIIHVKQEGWMAGIPVAEMVFDLIDPALCFTRITEEGAFVAAGTIIAKVEGSTRSILAGERLALNLLQRMSGIATQTRAYVGALEGASVKVTDTRKTTPGLRLLEKYAVRIGGGYNHRFGLYDAVMIKDNHIKGAGGITNAIQQARERIPHTMKIEVEVEHFLQLNEALAAKPDIIMLDNMNLESMKAAVALIRHTHSHIMIEASGGVSLATIKDIAATGVDIISVGALTHSVPSLDISLDLNERKETKQP
ncbi:MAG TPA: carboxylating nicotinate-nucleotide diphosphorylase [Bacilli bacterium]